MLRLPPFRCKNRSVPPSSESRHGLSLCARPVSPPIAPGRGWRVCGRVRGGRLGEALAAARSVRRALFDVRSAADPPAGRIASKSLRAVACARRSSPVSRHDQAEATRASGPSTFPAARRDEAPMRGPRRFARPDPYSARAPAAVADKSTCRARHVGRSSAYGVTWKKNSHENCQVRSPVIATRRAAWHRYPSPRCHERLGRTDSRYLSARIRSAAARVSFSSTGRRRGRRATQNLARRRRSLPLGRGSMSGARRRGSTAGRTCSTALRPCRTRSDVASMRTNPARSPNASARHGSPSSERMLAGPGAKAVPPRAHGRGPLSVRRPP